MKLTAIIPTHNRKYQLRHILQCLYQQDDIADVDLKIVVVNDGSSDGTSEMLEKKFPRVYQVKGDGNWWYTKSMNEGFRFAKDLKADYILTLNDDIVIQDNYLSSILDAVKQVPGKSIIGSITYTMSVPHKIVTSGVKRIIKWRRKLITYHPPFFEVKPIELSGVHKSFVLPGRGILIPSLALEELNGFDGKFAQYHSDFDFCLRAKKAGYNSFISWDSVIFSYVDKTASGSSFLKTTFKKFLGGFFNKHSRIYLLDNVRYTFRHGNKLLFPVTFIIFILATFKAYFFNKKIG